MPSREVVRTGVVAAYDEQRGLGEITDADTGAVLTFHCTAIAGGGRSIAAGCRVAFLLRPSQGGSIEATAVTPLSRS